MQPEYDAMYDRLSMFRFTWCSLSNQPGSEVMWTVEERERGGMYGMVAAAAAAAVVG